MSTSARNTGTSTQRGALSRAQRDRADGYERLVEVIRQELAPLGDKLDKLEATMEAKYYTREAIDAMWREARAQGEGLIRENKLEMAAMKEDIAKQATSWQVLGTRMAAWASVIYIVYQLVSHIALR